MSQDLLREIREIRASLESLYDRLHRLEGRVRSPASQAPVPSLLPTLEIPEASGVKTKKSESGMGAFLGVVGVVCFVLAASLIVKLAVDSGWLTPLRQWALCGLLGVGLYLSAFLVRFKDRDYSQYLLGAGVVVLYFAAYSSRLHFGIGTPLTSALMASAVSGLCLWTFSRFRHDFFVVTASAGAYFGPVLLGRAEFEPHWISAYFLILSATFSWLSIRLRSRALPLVSAYLALGLYAALNLSWPLTLASGVALVQFAQFLLFALGVVAYSVRLKSPMRANEAWSYFPVLLFFYATEYFLIERFAPGVAPWVSLGFSAILVAFYHAAKKRLTRSLDKGLDSGQIVTAFAAVAVFHSGYLVLFPEAWKPVLLPFIVFVAAAAIPKKGKALSSVFVLFAAVAICVVEYSRILIHVIAASHAGGAWRFVSFGLLSVLAFLMLERSLARRDQNARTASTQVLSYLALGCAHLMAVVSTYRLAHAHGSLAVTAVWAAYALLILGYGFVARDPILARSSAVVLLFATAKALLYDASQAAAPVRILCLLLTGAVLYFSGYLFRRIDKLK